MFLSFHTKAQNLLKNVDITKIQELRGNFKKVWLSSEYLRTNLNILGFNKIHCQISFSKKAGFSFEALIATLLILPLIIFNSIYEFTTNKDKGLSKRGKDSYYRILGNKKINWRVFLARFVKQYLLKDALFTSSKESTRCLIFDYITRKIISNIEDFGFLNKTYDFNYQ